VFANRRGVTAWQEVARSRVCRSHCRGDAPGFAIGVCRQAFRFLRLDDSTLLIGIISGQQASTAFNGQPVQVSSGLSSVNCYASQALIESQAATGDIIVFRFPEERKDSSNGLWGSRRYRPIRNKAVL